MANKKFNIPIEIPIIENTESILTDSDHVVIYAKPDGKIYKKTADGVETLAVLPDYFSVETTQDFNNIPESVLRDGMFVYVVEEQTDYRRSNGVWVLNSIKYNQSSTYDIHNYYVDCNVGSDLTGDGTQASPWQSLEHCLKTIPSIIYAQTNIYLAEGDYQITEELNYLFGKMQVDKNFFRLYGQLDLIRDDFTTAGGVTSPTNPYEKTVAGATWAENTYYGYALYYGSMLNIEPCSKHMQNAIVGTEIANKQVTAIYEYKTRLIINRKLVMPIGSSIVQFRNLILDVNNNNTLIDGNAETTVQILGCRLDTKAYAGLRACGSVDVVKCLFNASITGTNWVIQNADTNVDTKISIKQTSISNAIKAGYAIAGLGKDLCIDRMIIDNFSVGLYLRNGASIKPNVQYAGQAATPIVFKNIDTVFYITGNGTQLNWTIQNQIYAKSIQNMVMLYQWATNNLNIDFRHMIANPDEITNMLTGAVPTKLVDPARNINIVYPGSDSTIKQDWKEIEW